LSDCSTVKTVMLTNFHQTVSNRTPVPLSSRPSLHFPVAFGSRRPGMRRQADIHDTSGKMGAA
jgi:hypothetical protein